MPDNEGRTALMWAAQRGNYKVLEVMLQKEVDVHAFDNLGGTGGQGHIPAYLSPTPTSFSVLQCATLKSWEWAWGQSLACLTCGIYYCYFFIRM